jgi:hypothetical protein
VYDMYPWNEPEEHGDPADRATRRGRGRPGQPAAEALQVALDRRDNGGESPAGTDQ